MEHRALQHPLETQRRLHLALVVLLQAGGGLLDKLLELLSEPCGIGTAGTEDLADLGSVDDGEQQVLDRHELVPRLARRLERLIQADFEFAAQHFRQASSIVHRSGCWCSRA